ncbi:MAG: SufD family Fe-S cluster assembly protein [Candidatus Shikimatogenerans bostrichidophilus]|nr:MAG: SufD family Fe-S cluster assembly protein [Candidatus Shikimatogenerans bostrichidophilus]
MKKLIFYKINNKKDINISFFNNKYLYIKNKIKENIFISYKYILKKNKYVFNIKKKSKGKKPIRLIINFIYFNYVNILINKKKIIFIIDKNLNITIKENYILKDIYNFFFNFFNIVIIIKDKSKVFYLKYKNFTINNINYYYIYQKKNSILFLYDVNLYENISYNKIIIYNIEKYTSNYVYGTYILNKNQKIKNKIIIHDYKNNCKNIQNYIGIYNGKSNIYLKGLIKLFSNTIKNKSYQNYKNYILSNKVKLNFKPYLNINTNNVKCSHGFNLGEIDNNIIYYLQTRKINLLKAKYLFFLSTIFINLKIKNKFNFIKKKIKKKLITIL